MFTAFPPDLSHGCFGENDDSRHDWTHVQGHKNASKRKHETRSESDIIQSMKRSTNVMKVFNAEVAPPKSYMSYKMNVQKPTEARTVPPSTERPVRRDIPRFPSTTITWTFSLPASKPTMNCYSRV